MGYQVLLSSAQLSLLRRVLRSVDMAPLTAEDLCPRRPESFYASEPLVLSDEEREEIFLLQGCMEDVLNGPEDDGMLHGLCP